jgi:acetolactate synthase I/II/III large subunit
VRMTCMPCTNTLMGLGTYPAEDPQFLGMLGMHGTYEANLAMHGCDVMFNIGARFDDRVTGRLNAFSPTSKKIHADIDPSSINKNVAVDVPIVGDAGAVLAAMIEAWKADEAPQDKGAIAAWWRQIDGWRSTDCLQYRQESKIIKPQHAVSGFMKSPANWGARPSSPPKLVSTRCGPRSISALISPIAG